MHKSTTIDPAAPPIETEPAQLKPPRRSAMGSIIGHTGFNVARYYLTHVFGALFPLLAGLLYFGWRAGFSVFLVIAATLAAGLIWRRIGSRGRPLRPVQLLWYGMLLGLVMPATLLQFHARGMPQPWPMLPASGLLLVMICWAFAGTFGGRFHPVVVVYLLLAMVYPQMRKADLVLQRTRMLSGDLLSAPEQEEIRWPQASWRKRAIDSASDALRVVPPARSLLWFGQTERAPDESSNRQWNPGDRRASTRISLDTLLRDYLPPLEDLVLGAVPGGIGTTSAVAIIVGGLFLLYRGLIDYRVPLLIVLSAWVALIVLPMPAGMKDQTEWYWFPGHLAGWSRGITLANYHLLASPLLFTAFFLAGSPTVRPLTRKGRALFAVLVGTFAAGFGVYLSVSLGSYLALLVIGPLAPLLDRFAGCRALVSARDCAVD